jgi:hypothetical protein
MGKKEEGRVLGTQKWAKARDQTHGQIETGKGHWRKLVPTY